MQLKTKRVLVLTLFLVCLSAFVFGAALPGNCNSERPGGGSGVIDGGNEEKKDSGYYEECLHEKSGWEIVQYPSCTELGIEEHWCYNCGRMIDEREIPVLGHEPSGLMITEEATCVKDGKKEDICTRCSEVLQSEIIPATGHNYENRVCTNCGEPEPVCKHPQTEWVTTKQPSCTENGERKNVCNICDDVVKIEEIAKLAHTPSDWIIDKKATCTESGSRYNYCTVCSKKLKTEIINELGHSYMDGGCVRCGKNESDYTRIGDFIYFGSYPQKLKASDVSITDTINEKGYYLGSDGAYYAKAIGRGGGNGTVPIFANGEAVVAGQVYYFKVDPIKWRILEEVNGKVMLLCDSAIDLQPYYNGNSGTRIIDGKTVYENNYAESYIRSWLNSSFFNIAFTSPQQALIKTTLIDNGVISTNPYINPVYWNNGANQYVCQDTLDKVFLFSVKEETNRAYDQNTMIKKASDYAASNSWSARGPIDWWLRSPYYADSAVAWHVDSKGYPEYHDAKALHGLGIVPALWLNIGEVKDCPHVDISGWIVDRDATCTTEGSKHKVCIVCEDAIEVASIEKKDHVVSDWVITKQPTCTESGSRYNYCTVCSKKLKTESISALGHNYVGGVCARCGAKEVYYTRDGNYIYFGSYPQSRVTDSSTKSMLYSYIGHLPSEDNDLDWTDYKYYINSYSNVGNAAVRMWYKDVVVYGGEKYRAVYIQCYRAFWVRGLDSENDTYQDDNGYYRGVYWFKYEPIKWRILTEKSGSAFLMSDIAIDSQSYKFGSSFTVAGETTYANNYSSSDIRYWLNKKFYNTAFSDLQKAIINTTLVDNSIGSMIAGSYEMACKNTNDKIFLLSSKEVLSSAYGFWSSNSPDNARKLKSSDYAKSQGCMQSADRDYLGNCDWWLRTPDEIGNKAKVVNSKGQVLDTDTGYTCTGVVPALWLTL